MALGLAMVMALLLSVGIGAGCLLWQDGQDSIFPY